MSWSTTALRIAWLGEPCGIVTPKDYTQQTGQTVEARLARRLDAITWIGYAIHSVDADFGRIEMTNP